MLVLVWALLSDPLAQGVMICPLAAVSAHDDSLPEGVGHSYVEKMASVPADVLALAFLVVVLVSDL